MHFISPIKWFDKTYCTENLSVSETKFNFILGSGDVDGIGAATALHLVQFQPKLVITGRNQEKLFAVADTLYTTGLATDRVSPVYFWFTVMQISGS